GTTITLTATSEIIGSTPITYKWYKQGEITPFAEGKQIRYTVNTNETIFVTASSEGGCETIRQEVIIISTTPIGSIQPNKNNILQGDLIEFTFLQNETAEEAVRFEWDFGDGNKSFDKNPRHYFNKPGE